MSAQYTRLEPFERDIILGALRLWQDTVRVDPKGMGTLLWEIARESRGEAATFAEIDALAERLNNPAPIDVAHECPVCGSHEVEGQSVDIEDDTARQGCYCYSCGADWVLGFGLTSVDVQS